MREFKDIQEIYGTLRHMQAILKRPTLINAMNNYSDDEFYLQNAMSEDAVYDMACALFAACGPASY